METFSLIRLGGSHSAARPSFSSLQETDSKMTTGISSPAAIIPSITVSKSQQGTTTVSAEFIFYDGAEAIKFAQCLMDFLKQHNTAPGGA